MRQIILDTETTGLDYKQGHRIIEVGCVELINRKKTDQTFHHYVNPERDIDDGAYEVHGISSQSLEDKPVFRDIARDFLAFIQGAELIIHNAPFDVGFINNELELLGTEWGRLEEYCRITDTLIMAREKHPGQKNSLDALCQRYAVDNSQREQHGALLDALILLDVYLAMTGGQATLLLEENTDNSHGQKVSRQDAGANRKKLAVIQPTENELAAHIERLETINRKSEGNCIWLHRMQEEN